MKSITIAFVFLVSCFNAISQNVELTPELQRKIKRDIEKEIPALRRTLEKDKSDSAVIEFIIDTFRIERYTDRCMALNYSDFAMRDVTYTQAHLYDSLMNKYYRKLLNLLKGDDKKVLIQAQKAWLAFRDAEVKLLGTITEYSSGGTMQMLAESSHYLEMVQRRAITIFEHYMRAARIY